MGFRYGFNKVAYITNCKTNIRVCIMPKRLGVCGGTKRKFDEETGEWLRSEKAQYVACLRAKRAVVDYALCNKFDYFGTITISDDRFEVKHYEEQVRALDSLLNALDYYRQFISPDFRYVICPEYGEKKGRLHFHFIVSGISKEDLFINHHHHLDWKYIKERFGHVQISKIKDTDNDRQRVAFYCSKYISKQGIQLRSHRYFASHDLQRPAKMCMDDISYVVDLCDWLEMIGEKPYAQNALFESSCYSLHYRMFYDFLKEIGHLCDKKRKFFTIPTCNGYQCDPFT